MNGEAKGAEKVAVVKNGVRRMVFVAIAILLEMIVIVLFITLVSKYASWISGVIRVLAIVIAAVIYSRDKNVTIKLSWVILTLAFSMLGITLYVLIGLDHSTKRMRARFEEADEALLPLLEPDDETVEEIGRRDAFYGNLAAYIQKYGHTPPCRGSAVEYYDDAVPGLDAQLRDLETAEKFIFMDYHAIEDAESFHRVVEILERKVQEGVEVRLMYDDMGSIWFINHDFQVRMMNKGIRCRVFNPVAPRFNMFFNNRDHRKITVIDGRVGFLGGYNLANEYFNLVSPFGQWKDSGVRLAGPAVRSLTVLFLEMWYSSVGTHDDYEGDRLRYFPETAPDPAADGIVQPYADNPMGPERVGEEVYMSIIESARRYVWFITPYLILTDEMNHALSLAAKRGVDVRIVTPGIPDKKITYRVTRSYYNGLVRNGVRIFEFTPGFCHTKDCVCDDTIATVGTVNLDFRSMYHNFEDGCVFYGGDVVRAVKKDFEDTFPLCREVTEQYNHKLTLPARLWQMLLRVIAPLL